MSLFGGNPFATAVGQKIEQATDASLASENWSLNMEICDIINETDDGAKDAIRAIRKKLQQNAGKNYTVVMYTLTVLETCVKNCGRKLHLLATSKEFVQELVKLIGPKNDPPTVVQEKVLSLIQSWAEAFIGNPEMNGVIQVYNDLKGKGIEFPVTDTDASAPIHTPQRSVEHQEQAVVAQQPPRSATRSPPTRTPASGAPGAPQQPVAVVPPVGPVVLNHEQLAKLRSELDAVQSNMRVLAEMLTELMPGKEHPSDLELLQDLFRTCKAMQNRLVQLIDRVANEEVTSELLRLNDEMNNLFLRYERYEKGRKGIVQAAGGDAASSQPLETASKVKEEKSLIDLGDDTPTSLSAQLAGLAVTNAATGATATSNSSPHNLEHDFDMFAQSRTTTNEPSKPSATPLQPSSTALGATAAASSSATAATKTTEESSYDERLRDSDFDEIENWLRDQPTSPGRTDNKESITSAEFDRFLAERASVVDNLPTPPTTDPGEGSRSNPARREIEKDKENRLFAL